MCQSDWEEADPGEVGGRRQGLRQGLHATTPPLEVVKFLIVQAATKCRQGEVWKVMLIDISKAHLYAPVEGEQWVSST